MPDDRPLRRASLAAGAAFLLLATSLLLPWWVVSNRVAGSKTPLAAVFPLGSSQGIVHPWAQWLTAALVAVAILLLFLRVASRAWAHEPAVWRRDLAIAAAAILLALASGMLWPDGDAQGGMPFWGGRTFLLDNATGEELAIVANPGLGWWLAAVAAALVALAGWGSRPGKAE
ncbi:MAG TPA: hypothetical protein VHI93_06405 [Candidatus Thermoplasmatota archaeon]|nr:hypothetical protein [Candidatus Thermoplasmatota archaeon]